MKTTPMLVASFLTLLVACSVQAADPKPANRVVSILDVQTDDPIGYAIWMKRYNEIAKAKLEVEKAQKTVQERQRAIERSQRRMTELADAIVTTLAPDLPRLSGLIAAHRERLADQLERDEYALIDDEHELEAAQERAQQAGAELTRALAREDAVRGLAKQARRAVQHAREQRAELEIEDQGRRPIH